MVILTGGANTMSKVTVYNDEGFVADWPELKTGRFDHGCGHYINTDNKVVRNIIDKGRMQKENTVLRDIVREEWEGSSHTHISYNLVDHLLIFTHFFCL